MVDLFTIKRLIKEYDGTNTDKTIKDFKKGFLNKHPELAIDLDYWDLELKPYIKKLARHNRLHRYEDMITKEDRDFLLNI